MECLKYPFDGEYIIKKKKSIKRELLENGKNFLDKKVAILGGSTTSNVKLMLELFLLDYGIKPEFYESEYNQFYQEAVFDSPELDEFAPDIIYIHTSNRNVEQFPQISASEPDIEAMLNNEFARFESVWESLRQKYRCPIIQNNFELPYYRLMGNKDASDMHGRVHYISSLNEKFYEYARAHEDFYINDINYISACYGLDKWSDQFAWNMYKYCCAIEAIPDLAYNIARIIKAIYGKNKKGFVLDLDNTLWGGVIGDDGADNIEIGQETSVGQAYSEFQAYLKAHKQMGIILNVDSKNDYENALAGLEHPESILKPDDFVMIKANWEPKDRNFDEIAQSLNLLPESLVFIDDNPAEREIVRRNLSNVEAPEINKVENYIRIIDKMGFFEVTNISADDVKRNEMYKENAARAQLRASFDSYEDYLISLEMTAEIRAFEPVYVARIAQLTNKSNQFNLTTKRYTKSEIEEISTSEDYITLYGKLADKFGDNGVVSVLIGKIKNNELYIDLWLMSCRVLKRDMEYAMMDELVKQCRKKGIQIIHGFYYPTAKNAMVKDFYGLQGFSKESEDDTGNSEWKFIISADYKNKNKVIKVED